MTELTRYADKAISVLNKNSSDTEYSKWSLRLDNCESRRFNSQGATYKPKNRESVLPSPFYKGRPYLAKPHESAHSI